VLIRCTPTLRSNHLFCSTGEVLDNVQRERFLTRHTNTRTHARTRARTHTDTDTDIDTHRHTDTQTHTSLSRILVPIQAHLKQERLKRHPSIHLSIYLSIYLSMKKGNKACAAPARSHSRAPPSPAAPPAGADRRLVCALTALTALAAKPLVYGALSC